MTEVQELISNNKVRECASRISSRKMDRYGVTRKDLIRLLDYAESFERTDYGHYSATMNIISAFILDMEDAILES